MNEAEFDKFAEEYRDTHASNIGITGEGPEFFARQKIEILAKRCPGLRERDGVRILDFGTGIGNSLPFLREYFPKAEIVGLDVSRSSLSVAEHRFPGVAKLVHYSGGELPFEPGTFDVVFSACVFHHIDHDEHVGLFERLRGLLRPDGRMVIFEHNPVNPVTRYIVATCPFDENAVLIPAGELKHRQAKAGFKRIDVTYTGFFPSALAALRPLEPMLSWAPIGAQYYTLATA